MVVTKALFYQLIDKTDDLLRVIQPSSQIEGLEVLDQLFIERELLLKQLSDKLQHDADINKYQQIYESWQVKEKELLNLVKTSLKEVEEKIKEAQNARTISTQYDSYLRQMPYGAFVDKKR